MEMKSGSPRTEGARHALIDWAEAKFDHIAAMLDGVVAHKHLLRRFQQRSVRIVFQRLLDRKAHATDSQVAYSTGYLGSTISEILDAPQPNPDDLLTVGEEILKRWSNDPDFMNRSTRRPARLIIRGPGNSFRTLLGRVARGVTPRTAIDALAAHGVVSVVGKFWVELLDADWRLARTNAQRDAIAWAEAEFDRIAAAADGVIAHKVLERRFQQRSVITVHGLLADRRKRATLTRIAWSTGYDTHTIRDILNRPRTDTVKPLTVGEEIVERWASDPDFLGHETARPLKLPFYEGSPYLRKLLGRVNRSVTPHTAIDALAAHGTVRVDDNHQVELLKPDWKLTLSEREIRRIFRVIKEK